MAFGSQLGIHKIFLKKLGVLPSLTFMANNLCPVGIKRTGS